MSCSASNAGKEFTKIYTLRHKGTEHVFCYAPPRNVKGVVPLGGGLSAERNSHSCLRSIDNSPDTTSISPFPGALHHCLDSVADRRESAQRYGRWSVRNSDTRPS